MMNESESNNSAQDEYRALIQKVARAVANNSTEEIVPHLSKEFEPKHVEMFVDDNFDKRIDVLLRLMPFVSEDEDFEHFEELAVDFASQIPVDAYDGSSEECDAMLAWLEKQPLTPDQQDTVICQRSRYQIEQIAREKHGQHVRFQELVSVASELAAELEKNPEILVHLNPVHDWSVLKTKKYLAEGENPPVSVLHYADNEEIRTAMFETEGQILFEKLAEIHPCTIKQWSALTDSSREEVLEFARNLVSLRLLAFS